MTLTGAAVLHNRDAAVLVAGKGGLLSASALLVSDVAAEEHSQRFAIGVIAQEFGRLDLVDSLVRKIAGIGLFFADGTGRVVRSELDDNPVALHTQGSSRIKLGEAPGIPQQWEVLVDEETQLLRNGSRLGSGTLPLPTLHEVVKVHH